MLLHACICVCTHTHHRYLILLLMGTWLVPGPWLLKAVNTGVQASLSVLFSTDKPSEVELLGQVVVLFLTF